MRRAGLAFLLALRSLPLWAADECEKALTRPADSIVESAAASAAAVPANELKARLESAQKFRAFFGTVQSHLLERDDMLDMTELALLAKEHVLLMGPPGNAKSKLAKTVLSSMVEPKTGEPTKLVPSFYRIQMTPETTMSETHGPLDFKILTDTGRQERIYDQGMLMSRNVFIDEIFDARANANRNVLGLLNEREHAQGPNIVPGRIETVIAATNKYISEVYEKVNDESPKALLDRFAFTVFVPKDLEYVDSYLKLLQTGKSHVPGLTPLSFADLDRLRAMTDEVELPDSVAKAMTLLSRRIAQETENMEQSSLKTYREKIKNGEETPPPYRATKYMSPRTVVKAGYILRAIVVQDWMRSGGARPLVANLSDVAKLRTFFTLNGPSDDALQRQLNKSTNAHERVQLMAIAQEREIFDRHYSEIMEEVNRTTVKFDLTEIELQLDGRLTASEKEKLGKQLVQILVKCQGLKGSVPLADDLTGEEIGIDLIETFARDSLKRLLGPKYETEIVPMVAKLEKERAVRVAAERAEAARVEAERIKEAKRLEQLAKLAAEQAQRFQHAPIESIMENVGHGNTYLAVDPVGPAYVHFQPYRREMRVKHRMEPEFYLDTGTGALAEFVRNQSNEVWRMYLLNRDTIVMVTEGHGLVVGLHAGKLLYKFKVPVDRPQVAASADGRKLVTFDEDTHEFTVVDWAKKTQVRVKADGRKHSEGLNLLKRLLQGDVQFLINKDATKGYVASGEGIVEMNLKTSTLKVVFDGVQEDGWRVVPTVTDDGRLLLVQHRNDELAVRELQPGKDAKEYLISTGDWDSFDLDNLNVSPDGATLYVSDGAYVYRVDLASRAVATREFPSSVRIVHFVDADGMILQMGNDLVRLKFSPEGK